MKSKIYIKTYLPTEVGQATVATHIEFDGNIIEEYILIIPLTNKARLQYLALIALYKLIPELPIVDAEIIKFELPELESTDPLIENLALELNHLIKTNKSITFYNGHLSAHHDWHINNLDNWFKKQLTGDFEYEVFLNKNKA